MANLDAAEKVAEDAVEKVLEEVVPPTIARSWSVSWAGSLFVGLGMGAAAGFYFGYRYTKKNLRKELMEEADGYVNEMRQHYLAKITAHEGAEEKGDVDEILQRERYAQTISEGGAFRTLRAPVPVQEPLRAQNPPEDHPFRTDAASKDKHEGWNYPQEMTMRRPGTPYIIHQDEFAGNETGYGQGTLVLYTLDDILVDQDDPNTPLINRNELIGTEALERFGHGSDDYNVVYVRNSMLELEYEVNRVAQSWEEQVLGLSPDDDETE